MEPTLLGQSSEQESEKLTFKEKLEEWTSEHKKVLDAAQGALALTAGILFVGHGLGDLIKNGISNIAQPEVANQIASGIFFSLLAIKTSLNLKNTAANNQVEESSELNNSEESKDNGSDTE